MLKSLFLLLIMIKKSLEGILLGDGANFITISSPNAGEMT
jgi:hypothetical protein